MAIDTCQMVSEEQNSEQQKLQENEIVSNSQSNENTLGSGQGIDLDHGWDFFQALKLKCLELFLKYHPTQSFRINLWFSIKKFFKLYSEIRLDYNIFDLRWFRKTHTYCILNMYQRHLLQPPTTHNTHPTHTMHTDLHANILYAEST